MQDVDDALQASAAWLGRFHAINEARLNDPSLGFLNRYNKAYYRSWLERTVKFAGLANYRASWLARLHGDADEVLSTLEHATPTVIHGEYYCKNIIVKLEDGTVYPVDWESAAVAPGEIDLASLTEQWPPDEALACEDAYCRARWPGGAPADFAKLLHAARIYMLTRWLGEAPDWTAADGYKACRQALRVQSHRWAMLTREIGRAAGRERGEISGVGVSI